MRTFESPYGSVSGPGHGPRWESKCGSDLRIQHGLNELLGSGYGRVLAFYAKSRTAPAPLAAVAEEMMSEKSTKSALTAAQRKALRAEREAVPAETRAAFDRAFAASALSVTFCLSCGQVQ